MNLKPFAAGIHAWSIVMLCLSFVPLSNAVADSDYQVLVYGGNNGGLTGVTRYRPDGFPLEIFAQVQRFPIGITSVGQDIYIGTRTRNSPPFILDRYSFDGEFQEQVAEINQEQYFMDSDAAGNIYLKTHRISPAGEVESFYVGGRQDSLDADADGNMYAVRTFPEPYSAQIVKLDRDGNQLLVHDISELFPQHLVVDEARELAYVGTEGGVITVFDISGDAISEVRQFDLPQEQFVEKITYDPISDLIYATGVGFGNRAYTLDGVFVQNYPQPFGQNFGLTVVPVPEPQGIILLALSFGSFLLSSARHCRSAFQADGAYLQTAGLIVPHKS